MKKFYTIGYFHSFVVNTFTRKDLMLSVHYQYYANLSFKLTLKGFGDRTKLIIDSHP
jgi:hypothetical protein